MMSANDFLFIYYDKGQFIVNRDQFSASVSLDMKKNLTKPVENIDCFINFNSMDIAIFDLDLYLRNHFKVETITSSKLSIISKLSYFSDNIRSFLNEKLFKDNSNLNREYIAFSITSSAGITSSPISRFKLFSKVLVDKQRENGILACSFKDSVVEYFIDIESIIYNTLRQQEGRI